MTNRNQKLTPTILEEVEVQPGRQLNLKVSAGTLFSVTKPNNQPLPRGMLAVQEKGKVLLKYPDGTEVVISQE